ncbi:MAG: hypothetical protein K2O67_01640, partial [Clostridia bacterium]|nr:hypothetical protein [Clostridia bacterium]
MKRIIKNKISACIIAAVVALLAVFCAVFSFSKKTTAQAYWSGDIIDNSIGNIFKSNGKFDKDNLDALAKLADFADIEEMVEYAEGGAIKTSEDFGNTVVNFGSYTFNGTTRELTWIPAYLSNSDNGPILTLWLASNEGSNTADSSNQELSTFSNGTSSATVSKSWNGSTIYSNTYDGSYIRNYVLNGSNSYTTAWGSGTPISAPEQSTMTKFSMFTTGALASYIVKPGAVSWQANANRQKNDPEWNGTGTGVKGTGANYPSAWLNDNLWLPSTYEIYDSTLEANSIVTSFTANGGLWHMGDGSNIEKLCSAGSACLRSGNPTMYNSMYTINSSSGQIFFSYVHETRAVRPALHLNLEAALNTIHTHKWDVNADTDADGWKVTKQATCTDKGEEQRVCTVSDCPLTDSKETREIAIDPAAHNYPETWSSNDTKHWHICANGCGVKGSEEDHTWDSGTVTEQPSCTKAGKKLLTCTTCQKTKTEDVPKSEHTYSSEWKYDANNHWHECSVCNAVQPNSTMAHSGGTADCENKAECGICNQAYGEYGEHTPETIPAVAPDCTTKGKTEGSKCSICQEVLTAQSDINALGHDFSITVSGTQPTCQQGGKATMKCSRCDETQEQNSADPVDHVFTS